MRQVETVTSQDSQEGRLELISRSRATEGGVGGPTDRAQLFGQRPDRQSQ